MSHSTCSLHPFLVLRRIFAIHRLRRLPPRISAEDLPDVWFCSMNTWDINLATCTAIEDKHEANSPQRTGTRGSTNSRGATVATNVSGNQQYNEQSQIPTSFGSSSKLSYRNLIFGNGRMKRNISERMRAQESLFSSQQEDNADMSKPPTCMYANSTLFVGKTQSKAASSDDEDDGVASSSQRRSSIFDIMPYSRVWQELNNNAQAIRYFVAHQK